MKLFRTYLDTANDEGRVGKEEFEKMLSVIFEQLGELEAATKGSPEAFFAAADSNNNGQISFPELVAVFEIEAARSR